MGYLEEVLEEQRVPPLVEEALRARRGQLERALAGGWKDGDPRFYYGGSFGKRTMIAAHFDLDLVVYFPPGTRADPRALYEAVEARLRSAGHVTMRHNVSVRLQYVAGLHVDVVPGRARDDSYAYADLWASEKQCTRQTSIKTHIDMVRNGGHRDVIRLLKLWRCRCGAPVGSFVLELAAERALRDAGAAGLEEQFERVLRYLRDSFLRARLVDPANSNNVVTGELDWARKAPVAEAAARACARSHWREVVW